MTHRILRAADYRRMPWKNGRGEMIEIFVYPQDAHLSDFGWRVSMAGVNEDGDFSIFPQIDRSLAVLGGEGIELQIQGHGLHVLTSDTPPLAFPADVPSSAQLLDGPITDLNVMTRRGTYRHQLSRQAPMGSPEWRLVVAMQPVTLPFAGEAVALQAMDALLTDGPEAALPIAPAPGLWQIGIWPA